MNNSSAFMAFKNFIAEKYGTHPGRMLIHTGVISWILSSAAQITAIIINDKIPKEQKLFLIPQEAADAGVNIASFYLITQSCTTLAKQLVKTGKLLPKSVKTFLEKNNYPHFGKVGTSIKRDGNLSPELADSYDRFFKGVDVAATTVGSILSCNFVTPIIRNEIAANRQKKLLNHLNSKEDISNVRTPKSDTYLPKPSIVDFQAKCYSNYTNSGSLKI